MPSGIAYKMSCENPSCNLSASPCTCARKPTPTRLSLRSKPALTPVTMLLTSARMVPDIALASRVSLATLKVSSPSSRRMSTFGFSVWVKVPKGPLTVICSASIVVCTLLGTTTGYFAMRDISVFSLGHVAQYFAAHAIGARFAIGHDPTRRGDNRNTQTVHDGGDGFAATVNA